MGEPVLSEFSKNFPKRATVVDVSARDGLQSVPQVLSADERARWVRGLLEAGIDEVEACSFVHPKMVPQMADAGSVLEKLSDLAERVWALVPNRRGLELALASGAKNIVCLLSATQTHSRNNLGRDIGGVMEELAQMARAGEEGGARLRLAVSMAWVDPDEGIVPTGRVAELLKRAGNMGFLEVTLCDTYGGASPSHVEELLLALSDDFPPEKIGLHMHDTFGVASANTMVALAHGITRFDASIGGLGGCPFAPGARGNMDTAHLLHLLDSLGVGTGVEREKFETATKSALSLIGRVPEGCGH